MSVTEAARSSILSAGVLTSLVPLDPAGNRAVYADVWSPSSAPKPYVLINFRGDRDLQQQSMRVGTLDLDVFLEGPSQKKAVQIRDAIVGVLDSARIEDANGDLYRIGELGPDAPAPTDDPALARRRFSFPVRWWRTAHLAAEAT